MSKLSLKLLTQNKNHINQKIISQNKLQKIRFKNKNKRAKKSRKNRQKSKENLKMIKLNKNSNNHPRKTQPTSRKSKISILNNKLLYKKLESNHNNRIQPKKQKLSSRMKRMRMTIEPEKNVKQILLITQFSAGEKFPVSRNRSSSLPRNSTRSKNTSPMMKK